MPRKKPFPTLYNICTTRIAQQIIDKCKEFQLKQGVDKNLFKTTKENHREYLSQLPLCVINKLMTHTLQMLKKVSNRTNQQSMYPTALYVVEILLNSKTQTLTVDLLELFNQDHQNNLFCIIDQHGSGLQRIDLVGDYFFCSQPTLGSYNYCMYSKSLPVCLQSLDIKVTANNYLMHVVADSCPRLKVLNVLGSRSVTDDGICYLLEYKKRSEVTDNAWILVNGQVSVDPKEGRSSLCNTLQILNVARTSVTSQGIKIAIKNLPNLQYLGDDFKVEKALQSAAAEWNTLLNPSNNIKPPQFNLTTISSWLTHQRLDLFSSTCPRLEKIVLVFQDVTAVDLVNLPSIKFLECICWSCLEPTWVENIYSYIKVRGNSLVDLRLKHYNEPSDPPPLSLDTILVNCSHLKTIVINMSAIHWTLSRKLTKNLKKMESLEFVELGEKVSGDAVLNLFALAPRLKNVHLSYCVNFSNDILDKIVIATGLENLECFFVRYGTILSEEVKVNSFVNKCSKLKKVGTLNWLVDRQQRVSWIESFRGNVELEVKCSYHWKNSSCIPKVF